MNSLFGIEYIAIRSVLMKNQQIIMYMDDVVPSTIESKIRSNFQQLMVIGRRKWVVVFALVCFLASYECDGFFTIIGMCFFYGFCFG